MASRLIDISPMIDSSIDVWPGDVSFDLARSLDMNAGDHMTLSSIRSTLHVGAHTDAPSHYSLEGQDIASRLLELYIGPCQVFAAEVARGERIMPHHVHDLPIETPRILFRTNTFPDHRNWNTDFASLSPELVDLLAGMGVRLVGIDTPSVDPFDSKLLEAHQALARHDMANLEGLDLNGVDPGQYELIALPLRIRGGDASPVRAILRVE